MDELEGDEALTLSEYKRCLACLMPGDEVGIKSGTGRRKKIYKIVTVIKVTAKHIVVHGNVRYWRDRGSEIGGLSSIELMSADRMMAWHIEQDQQKAEAEERKRNYNPADHDDHVQAALRSMRDRARGLCEKLQADVDDRLRRDPSGAMQPHWWGEYLQMLVNIEESENALKSVGLSTTLKPSAEQSSLFR